ncbi:hypothetical protein [Jeotgalibacillus soli]|uniref:Uncharacterized protein n=1 Tax=Jeotgalibacillus soli TaxID=889306 RepID=A0A0C2VLZ4_9BACL|nr:hypothetical protein [Jeotgalibacillus soli]KIL45003.1 hypothetical protein KP78_25470 [Jeotgalibacillus soli]
MKKNILTLKETRLQKPMELYGVVKKCVVCGCKHVHAAEEGNVVAHCIDLSYLESYDIVIDRNNEENLRLAEKYNISL